MPKITFYEFRPGKWVKLVDGQAVGPATDEEVAAWKREKAAPAHIWDDVVATVTTPQSGVTTPSGGASRPPSGEVATVTTPQTRVTTPSSGASRPKEGEIKEQSATAQVGAPAKRTESDQSMIWEDLVKRAKPSVPAEGPTIPHPRKEDMDQAEQARIWEDVVKRLPKLGQGPQRRPASETPVSPQLAHEEKPGPAAKAPSATTPAPAKIAPSPPVARPQGEGSGAKKAFAAEVVSPRRATKPPKATATARPEEKATPTTKSSGTKPAPRPAPPPRRAAEAKTKPAGRRTPGKKAVPAEPSPVPEAPAMKIIPKPAKPTAKARSTGKAVTAKKPAAPKRKSAVKDTLPARLLDEIEKEKNAPVIEPAEEAAPSAEKPAKSRGSPAVAPRHTARKARAAAAPERPNQLYLWITAGQTDDLVAAVRTGLARYQERFNQAAEVVLCHSADLPTLEGAKLPVDLREGKSLAPRNFWIGLK